MSLRWRGRSSLLIPVLLASLGVVLGFSGVNAKQLPGGVVWKSPRLDQAKAHVIAILPVVSVAGDGLASHSLEEALQQHYTSGSSTYIDPTEARERLQDPGENPDRTLKAVSRQIFRRTTLDVATAQSVARRLGADAILTLRIIRWERLDEGTPARKFALIRLSAALTAADGSPLWKLTQREAVDTPEALLPQFDPDPKIWYLRGKGGVEVVTEDFQQATRQLLTRFPEPPPQPK